MRSRAALVLAVVALAGCGGGDDEPPPDRRTPPPREVDQSKVDEAEKALEQLKESDLPEDARRQLEEAKRLLDEARRSP